MIARIAEWGNGRFVFTNATDRLGETAAREIRHVVAAHTGRQSSTTLATGLSSRRFGYNPGVEEVYVVSAVRRGERAAAFLAMPEKSMTLKTVPRSTNLSRRAALATAFVLMGAVACDGAPKSAGNAAAWKAVAEKKDAAGAWLLLDDKTRTRIVKGLTRAQTDAATDGEFRALFTAACAPADVSTSAEDLGKSLLGPRLNEIARRAEAAAADRAGVLPAPEPVGFVRANGCPLTLEIRFAAQPPKGAAGGGLKVDLSGNGMTDAEIEKMYAKYMDVLVPELKADPDFLRGAGRLMYLFHQRIIPRKGAGVGFEVKVDGTLAPAFKIFSESTFREENVQEPILKYGPWPE